MQVYHSMMSKKLPDNDGFITVTRKGRKNRKILRKEKFAPLLKPEAEYGMFDKQKFESALEDIRNSDFWTNFKEQFSSILKNHFYYIESAYQVHLLQNVNIVCYGLGNFVSSVTARYQLALLVVLKELFLPKAIDIYDPLFSKEEKTVLEDLGMNVLDANEEAKRTVLYGHTIFYMPHCSLPLYNNLLWANWNKDSLSKLIIIGNSFEQYLLHRTEKWMKEKAAYVNYASEFVTETKIVNNFKFSDIFNNSSVHCFHINALSKVPCEVWSDNTEPVYDYLDEIFLIKIS